MKVVNYKEFRNRLIQNLNEINKNREIIVVSRSNGKKVVVMDMNEYNSIQETFYVTSTKANRKRLEEAITEMYNGH